MNAPWVTEEATAAAEAPEWADIRALVRERVAAMAELAGQRGRPGVNFDPRWTAMESATGVDAGAPIGYKPMPLWDQVCVHLPARFGETPPSVSQVSIDALDGELMHELGHRRDRWLMTFLLFGGLALTVFVAGVGVLLAWNYTVAPQDEWLVLVGTVLCATGIAVAFVMHRCRVPLGRWFEHRADDYMARQGRPRALRRGARLVGIRRDSLRRPRAVSRA